MTPMEQKPGAKQVSSFLRQWWENRQNLCTPLVALNKRWAQIATCGFSLLYNFLVSSWDVFDFVCLFVIFIKGCNFRVFRGKAMQACNYKSYETLDWGHLFLTEWKFFDMSDLHSAICQSLRRIINRTTDLLMRRISINWTRENLRHFPKTSIPRILKLMTWSWIIPKLLSC